MSHDLDPPAVAQPTLPPPPVSSAPVSAPALSQRKRYVTGVVVAVACVAVGGYTVVASRGEDKRAAAHAAASVLPNRPADLLARIDQTLASLPRDASDVPCSGLDSAIPLVPYATAEARLEKRPPVAGESSVLAGAVPLAEIDQRLASAHRIAVIRTLSLTEPAPSVGLATPGRYEGQLVVVDTNTGAPLCHTRVVAWSSSIIDQPGLDKRTIRDDFTSRVQTSLAESASRLRIKLDL